MLTQSRVKELLDYDPLTGVFTYKTLRGRMTGGSVAGALHKHGYRHIKIDNKLYKEHVLAWLYVNGVFPSGHIDHIDHDKANNAISNLRDVNRMGNLQNQIKSHSNNKTGFLGVSLKKRSGKYLAQIQVAKKVIFIGHFDTPEEAHIAYVQAKRNLHSTCSI